MLRRHSEGLLIGLSTAVTMLAFAANSLLSRLAFQTTSIDPSSFMFIRIASGALVLAAILVVRRRRISLGGNGWIPVLLLFTYATAFSFAYRDISTGAGALVLFASAQLAMLAYGYCMGEKTSVTGLVLAIGGLFAFLAPSASAPPLAAAVLMAIAGLAWGAFSLVGKAGGSPLDTTATSFIGAVPLALILIVIEHEAVRMDQAGVMYAALSGSLTSGLGYVVWYWVRVRLTAISAGSVQLLVPILSAVLGMVILGEQMSAKSGLSAAAVLMGVALTTLSVKRPQGRRVDRTWSQ